MKRTHDRLVRTVAGLSESRLGDRVPGKRYDFYHMLHGIAQHELYHAGQIAVLKKAENGVLPDALRMTPLPKTLTDRNS